MLPHSRPTPQRKLGAIDSLFRLTSRTLDALGAIKSTEGSRPMTEIDEATAPFTEAEIKNIKQRSSPNGCGWTYHLRDDDFWWDFTKDTTKQKRH